MSGRLSKIIPLDELEARTREWRDAGKTIVHCHGVFDLLHIGHIKHLQAARQEGDVLVVTITPDRFVNKGPHRPAFPERLRAEALAALDCVEAVAINDTDTAVNLIQRLRPHLYVKGLVRGEGKRDHSDGFELEREAIEAVGGKLHLTDEVTYSASALINRHLQVFEPGVDIFLEDFRHAHRPEALIEHLTAIRPLKVLTFGEVIIDEYNFCEVMAKANKDPILATRRLETESYGGGILAIANHVANFCDEVAVLSVLGAEDPQQEIVDATLAERVHREFLAKSGSPTIVKRRFVETYTSTKLFEVYEMRKVGFEPEEEERLCQRIAELAPAYDVVIVADYGHGLVTDRVAAALSEHARFLAATTQINAGNRGFNHISKFPRLDFVSMAEAELLNDMRGEKGSVPELAKRLADRLGCSRFLLTRGRNGSICYEPPDRFHEVPALSIKTVDRIGAGDAVLSVTAPCAANGLPAELLGFIGNVVGAEACGIMGNKTAVDPSSLFRHLSSLLQ